MELIFKSILSGFLQTNSFANDVYNLTEKAVKGVIMTFMRMEEIFKPTPSKTHYTFNLRDVSKVIQGFLMTKSRSLPDKERF